MASTANLEEKLRGALDRLKRSGLVDSFYLAGGSALRCHFSHRHSDLGIQIASPLDLAVMKLAAISRRGIRRDYWDLYVIAKSGVPLRTMGKAYVQRFGVAEADLYHVLRALTFFDDAEFESTLPPGMTHQLWGEIRQYFLQEAPKLVKAVTNK